MSTTAAARPGRSVRAEEKRPPRPRLVIAAAQCPSVPGDVAANVERHLAFVRKAAAHGVRLLVFPELSLTGYELPLARSCALRPEDAVLDPLRRAARESGAIVVAGGPLRARRDELRLAALAFHPDGSLVCYEKQHLHPGEEHVFTAGTGGPAILVVDDVRVALAICADTGHPEHPAEAARRGAFVYAASVLVTESGYACDAAQLQGYACRHRMTVLLANHAAATGGWVPAGCSAVWSETGELVAGCRECEPALVVATSARPDQARPGAAWSGRVELVPV